MQVYVIVVTFRGKKWYTQCFDSLRRSLIQLSVIVIDNASNDDTVDFIKANYPEFILVVSKENLGFGQANNIGMRYALDHGGDYVFLLNQDAWIEPDTIARLIEVHHQYPIYGILSPMHLTADKKRIEPGLLSFLTWREHIQKDFISDSYLGILKDVYPVEEVNAAGWLLPRETLEQVGGFDPLFIHYSEDDNYEGRVIYHGYKIGIVPQVTICHDTERPKVQQGKYAPNFDKWLLQRATDLRYPDNQVDIMRREYAMSFLRKILSLHLRSALINAHNVRFLSRNKSKIKNSRNRNKAKAPTWIYGRE